MKENEKENTIHYEITGDVVLIIVNTGSGTVNNQKGASQDREEQKVDD